MPSRIHVLLGSVNRIQPLVLSVARKGTYKVLQTEAFLNHHSTSNEGSNTGGPARLHNHLTEWIRVPRTKATNRITRP